MGSVAAVVELQEEQEHTGDCGSGRPVLKLVSGPLDQVEPVAAAPEDLLETAEAPVGAPAGGEQSAGWNGEAPVLSRPRMGWHQQC